MSDMKDIKMIIKKICKKDVHGSYSVDFPPNQIKAIKRSQIKAYEKEIPGLKLNSFKNNKDSVVIDLEYQGKKFILTLV